MVVNAQGYRLPEPRTTVKAAIFALSRPLSASGGARAAFFAGKYGLLFKEFQSLVLYNGTQEGNLRLHRRIAPLMPPG